MQRTTDIANINDINVLHVLNNIFFFLFFHFQSHFNSFSRTVFYRMKFFNSKPDAEDYKWIGRFFTHHDKNA